MSKHEENPKIPVGKVRRAAKVLEAGAKVGGNYLKYYAQKAVDPGTTRDALDEANAADIYRSMSELKGTALKVAQMISMDRNILPRAFGKHFQMAQYQAPPLSYPLVVKTFRTDFGKTPEEIFDTFAREAVNAASIGQVHQATINGRKLAVKVQYPGVASSVESDLNLLRPIAKRLMNVKGSDLDKYMGEVRLRLLEETDYPLELKRSQRLSLACVHIPGLTFAHYYPEYSAGKVLTMDWIDGQSISTWLLTDPPQADRNRIGQAMWDFYSFQIHQLREVHADPHPGNFLITSKGELAVIDFGCVKDIPDDFYRPYFALMEPGIVDDRPKLNRVLLGLGVYIESDTDKERAYITETLVRAIEPLSIPFNADEFDFGDEDYFQRIYRLGEEVARDPEMRRSHPARGSQHGIYVNRIFFGLFNLLHELRACIRPGMKEIIARIGREEL